MSEQANDAAKIREQILIQYRLLESETKDLQDRIDCVNAQIRKLYPDRDPECIHDHMPEDGQLALLKGRMDGIEYSLRSVGSILNYIDRGCVEENLLGHFFPENKGA